MKPTGVSFLVSDVLRPDQRKLVDDMRVEHEKSDSVLTVLPTGGGKTHIMCDVTQKSTIMGHRTWLIAHRDRLVEQISERLKRDFGIEAGIVAQGYGERDWLPVQVCSINTLVNRLDRLDLPDMVHFDEAHHLVASTWQKVVAATAGADHFGYTATPIRLDGKGLRSTKDADGISRRDGFQSMVIGKYPDELADLGVLVRPVIYTPPSGFSLKGARRKKNGEASDKDQIKAVRSSKIMGKAVEHYLKTCNGVPGVFFAASVELAKEQAELFNAAGVPAASIDGKMTKTAIKNVLDQLDSGEILMVTSCDLISEGFDLPKCSYVGLGRQTASVGMYLQQVGRGLRAAPGKEVAFIFDHADNVQGRMHGSPMMRRDWSLDGLVERKEARDPDEESAANLKMCAKCFVQVKASRSECPLCGYVFPAAGREVICVDGQLVLFEGDDKLAARVAAQKKKEVLNRKVANAFTLSDFQKIAKEEGMSSGWAYTWHAIMKKKREGLKKLI